MFCPQCRVEYRPGFAHCTDCDVDLVDALPQPEEVGALSRGSLQILWEGEDLALFENLRDGLESAGIRLVEQPLGVYPVVRRNDPFPIQPMARFGYQVAVLSLDLGRARQILGKLLDEEPQDMELPVQGEQQNEPLVGNVLEEEPLICEVWSRSDESLSDFLELALKENGIPTRIERQGAAASIYAPSTKESAAKEIVREIVEGTPPGARGKS